MQRSGTTVIPILLSISNALSNEENKFGFAGNSPVPPALAKYQGGAQQQPAAAQNVPPAALFNEITEYFTQLASALQPPDKVIVDIDMVDVLSLLHVGTSFVLVAGSAGTINSFNIFALSNSLPGTPGAAYAINSAPAALYLYGAAQNAAGIEATVLGRSFVPADVDATEANARIQGAPTQLIWPT